MPTFANDSGTNKPLKNLYVKQAGVWLPVQRSSIKRNGAWVSTYDAEVKVTLSSETTNLDVQSLYSVEDWANTYKKKILVIPSGVVVGATSTSLAALNTGSGRGGLLEIVVDGEVLGAGGATTGAAGGAAINIEQSGVTVYVNGAVRGGGGAGGKGGTGGGGYYGTTVSQPASGWYGDNGVGGYYIYRDTSVSGAYKWYWARSLITTTGDVGAVTVGSYTYYRGSVFQNQGGGVSYSQIRRTYVATTNTSGGAGGSGGRGQGYDGALAAGAAGAAGGTNAGKGGTGGTGGIWGAVGATGATGANGNRTNGTAGAAGGAAGAAITGVARTVVNTGTINGSY